MRHIIIDPRSGRELYLSILMPSTGTAMSGEATKPATEPINALDLARRLGISVPVLAAAAHLDSLQLEQNPRSDEAQSALAVIEAIWEDAVAIFGTEDQVRLFFQEERPELNNRTPSSYLEVGRPGVVSNLLAAFSHTLP